MDTSSTTSSPATSAPGYGTLTPRARISVALSSLAIIAFAPAALNRFVHLDDEMNFVQNPHFLGVGWAQFAWAWRAHLMGMYQPFGWILYSTESAVWGLNPTGYHLASIALHALNTSMFFLLAEDLLKLALPGVSRENRTFGAAFATALFAVHPLRAEVVAWVSCQPYLPSTFFSLLAVWLYVRTGERGARRSWLLAGCWLAMAAAMLFKPIAVTLPLILPVLDVYPLRRLGGDRGRWFGHAVRQIWIEKLPFLGLTALFAALAVIAQRWENGSAAQANLSAESVARAFYGLVFYPWKTIVPTGISALYPIPLQSSLSSPTYLACELAVIGLTAGLILLRKRWPGMLAAWLAYVVLIAPNLGFFRIVMMIASNRYSYLATMPGFFLLAGGIAAIRPLDGRFMGRAAIGLVGSALIAGLAIETWRQCRAWRDSDSLWALSEAQFAADAKADPKSIDPRFNLAVVLLQREHTRQAIEQLRECIALDPTRANFHIMLGRIMARRGSVDEAIAAFSDGARLNPRDAESRCELGSLLAARGDLDRAAAYLQEANRLEPGHAEWQQRLGIVEYRRGSLDAASAALTEAVRLNPDMLEAREFLDRLLREQSLP